MLIPIASHVYRACIIGRNPNPGALRWQSYCNGRFYWFDSAGNSNIARSLSYMIHLWRCAGESA